MIPMFFDPATTQPLPAQVISLGLPGWASAAGVRPTEPQPQRAAPIATDWATAPNERAADGSLSDATLGQTTWATAQTPVDRTRVLQQIEMLKDRKADWDGYGGSAASEEAIKGASVFTGLLSAGTHDPEVEMDGDGEVTLTWRAFNRYLEVGFLDAETFTYFGRISSEGRGLSGSGSISDERLPTKLLLMLALFPSHADLRLRAA